MDIPEADPVAVARMKYEQENRIKRGMMTKATGIFRKSPDTSTAAKSGAPAMTRNQPSLPATVPLPAAAGAGVTDVSVSTVTDSSTLDSKPDARQNPPKPEEEKKSALSGEQAKQAEQQQEMNKTKAKKKKAKK